MRSETGSVRDKPRSALLAPKEHHRQIRRSTTPCEAEFRCNAERLATELSFEFNIIGMNRIKRVRGVPIGA